jgi:hypothetical protein
MIVMPPPAVYGGRATACPTVARPSRGRLPEESVVLPPELSLEPSLVTAPVAPPPDRLVPVDPALPRGRRGLMLAPIARRTTNLKKPAREPTWIWTDRRRSRCPRTLRVRHRSTRHANRRRRGCVERRRPARRPRSTRLTSKSLESGFLGAGMFASSHYSWRCNQQPGCQVG